MENTHHIETDIRKWLAFSQLINSATIIKEFGRVIDRMKSSKNIIITCTKESDGRRQYSIKEMGNSSILIVDDESIIELKGYFNKTYQQGSSKSFHHHPVLGKGNTLTNDTKPAKYLYYENKFRHTLTYSFYTIIIFQILLITKFILLIEFPLDDFLRYPIALIGLFYCLKYYKRYREYDLDYGDFFQLCWLFSAILFFFYFSEVTILSIPSEIPDMTWTSMIFFGTLIGGWLVLIISSIILAGIFNLLKRFI